MARSSQYLLCAVSARVALGLVLLAPATALAQGDNDERPLPKAAVPPGPTFKPPAPAPIPPAPSIAAHTATQPDAAPILRVETGMHTTLIRRLAVDAPRNRLVTASDDKTARVWQMPEARLVSILRVPIDKGHEGQLFGLAISPDGKTIAVGGWTGWDWEGVASIYFFDVASGELIKRYSGLKNAISALTWTPNGQHLIVGLQGHAGIVVLRTNDLQIIASDTQYDDKVMDIDIDHNGRVATVALDGWVRLYARDFRLIGRRVLPGGKKLSTVRFSPDAKLLAVAHIDQTQVTVASTHDLSFAFHPEGQTLPEQVGFDSIAWSSDGEYLYAAGDYQGPRRNPLYRWGNQGKGAIEHIPLADNRITEIRAMAHGAIAYVAEDPALGVVDASGKPVALRGPDIIDFSAAQLAVSADGSVVGYPLRRDTSTLHYFSPLLAGDQDLSVANKTRLSPPRLSPPRLAAPGWKIAHWKNSRTPSINGKRPKLDDYEIARSYAIAPNGQALLLGTEWALRLLDRNAQEIWNVSLPAVVWAVNISENGKLALAALSDGTLRWYRLSDGKEIFSYFPHNNGQDWIAWAPSGYYVSSIYGDNFVGWHLNRGIDRTPDFYRAVQFDRILYRPDIVAATFKAALTPNLQNVKRAAGGFDISKLRDIAPPRLKFKSISVLGTDNPRLRIELQGEKNRQAIQDVTLFVNNIPVTPSADRQLRDHETQRFTRTIEINLFDHHNTIRAEAFDGKTMGVAETYISAAPFATIAAQPGKLYLLAVGVNAFTNLPSFNLGFAAGDAETFANTMASTGKTYFKEVVTQIISDNSPLKPDKKTIVKALEFVKQSQPEDTVIIFLASHGMSDQAGNYYFIPHDAKKQEVLNLGTGIGNTDSLISWAIFFDALRAATGRRILIVDTCQARNIEGRLETHSLMKRSASSLFSMMLSSKGNEQSQEYPAGNHGLFTFSLLNALQPISDVNHDGTVSINELFALGKPLVEKLRDKSIGPQTPQLIAPIPLGETPLMRVKP